MAAASSRAEYRAATVTGYCAFVPKGRHVVTICEGPVDDAELALHRHGRDVRPRLGLGDVVPFTLEATELPQACYHALPDSWETGLGFVSAARRFAFLRPVVAATTSAARSSDGEGEKRRVLVRWFDTFDCRREDGGGTSDSNNQDRDQRQHAVQEGGEKDARCSFQLRIDGQDCLQHDVHTTAGTVHPLPATVTGICQLPSHDRSRHEVSVHESVLLGLSGGASRLLLWLALD